VRGGDKPVRDATTFGEQYGDSADFKGGHMSTSRATIHPVDQVLPFAICAVVLNALFNGGGSTADVKKELAAAASSAGEH
jgi:hypothetical protein